MDWRLARSLTILRREVDGRWPGRDKASDGSIGDAAHSARTSDHNPDANGVVRAIDIDDNDPTPAAEGIGLVIAEHLRKTRDPRVKYLIYHGRMCRSYAKPGVSPWQWTPYTGPNAHMRHLHISVVATSAADDERPWGLLPPPAPPAPPPTPEDDAMTDEQHRALILAVTAGRFVRIADDPYLDAADGAIFRDHLGRLTHVTPAVWAGYPGAVAEPVTWQWVAARAAELGQTDPRLQLP